MVTDFKSGTHKSRTDDWPRFECHSGFFVVVCFVFSQRVGESRWKWSRDGGRGWGES